MPDAHEPRPDAPERERICEALIDIVLEQGYERTTIEAIVERAGVDRADFDRHFTSLEDCFVQAFWTYAEVFERQVFAAFDRHESWRDRLRASAYAAAHFIRDNPRVSRFGSVEMMRIGPLAQAHRELQLQRIVDLIDAGRQELEDPDSMTRATAEATLGSVYTVAVREIARDTGGSFESLIPELMYIAVRPYLGRDVAREELTIPPPEQGGAGENL